MSYRICYGKEIKNKHREKPLFAAVGVVIIFAVWLFAFGFAMPKQAQRFRDMFFPWSQGAVQQALTDLREDIRDGLSFREAAQVFCTELLHDAQESP